ncbi:amidohydrolase [Crassaminicella profunda]|uniref:amidohydrolase n=1 Tax=Crassaminicella profunda TaxID=1286698 RepID=UPI001CA6D63B|nr:amidohydrolase [Crassaminicella profunda]QZY55914.1 amidohydrolase [Crassaminicella profunda]
MLSIINGKILTMDQRVIEKGYIIIKNGKIKDIGVGEGKNIPENGEVIDAQGKIVLPGFIDAHTHIGLVESSIGFEGADHNEKTNPINPQLRAIDSINPSDIAFKEAIEGGITCTAAGPGSSNVLGGQFSAIKTYGNRIDDMILKENIGMKCAFGENPKRNYNEKGKMPMTRMGIASLLREALFKAKDYKKRIDEAGEDYLKRPAFDMKLESLIPVINKEIPLKVHAHRADDMFTAIRIAKEFDVNMTLDHCTEGHLIAEEIKKEGLHAIVGPSLTHRSKFELSNRTFETPKILSEAGIKIALMTDHPVIPLQYLSLCAALAVKAGMDEEEALKAITIYPAEILGIDASVGSLKVGKDADVVIWEKHPFITQAKVEYTIINGKVVYKRSN